MPGSYDGDSSGISAHQSVTISVPADGDPDNAASLNVGTKKLADFMAYLQAKAGLLDQANAWTKHQTFATDVSGTPAINATGTGVNGAIRATSGVGGYGIEAFTTVGGSAGILADSIVLHHDYDDLYMATPRQQVIVLDAHAMVLASRGSNIVNNVAYVGDFQVGSVSEFYFWGLPFPPGARLVNNAGHGYMLRARGMNNPGTTRSCNFAIGYTDLDGTVHETPLPSLSFTSGATNSIFSASASPISIPQGTPGRYYLRVTCPANIGGDSQLHIFAIELTYDINLADPRVL